MAGGTATAEETARAVGDFFGLPPLAAADLGSVAVAAGIIGLTALAMRLLQKRIARWLESTVVSKLELDEHKVPFAVDYLAAALSALLAVIALSIAAGIYPWPPYAGLLFDLAIPLGGAIAAYRFASAFDLSGSAASAVAVVCGGLMLTNRYEQLDRVEGSLDQLAISLGGLSISLLDVLSLGLAAVVLYAAVRLANSGSKAFIRRRTNLDTTQSLLAEKVAGIAIVVIAIFVGIDILGIDTTSLSIFSGAIGLGLGFGLQKIFSNLASGLILLMDRSIKPGDVIVVGQAVGKVNRIGTRAVSVITRDGKEHLIPNELLMTERVENWSFSSREVRIRLSVGVAYDSDLDLVERLLKDVVGDSPRALDSPAPVVWITELGSAGIVHELRFWIRDPEDGLGNVQGEIYRGILTKFGEHGIVMPSPGREIRITQVPPVTLSGGDQP